MQSLLIHGRQPVLGRAELESLYGANKLTAIGTEATAVDIDPCFLAFDRLGGSVKFCKILTILQTTRWHEIEEYLLQVSPGHSKRMADGKMQLGLSLYGFSESVKRIEATGLKLKKAIRETGRSVRLIPNKEPVLNTAQVLHNNLTGPTGWELVFIKNMDETVVAQTVKVQDIEAYTQRDQMRPKRDAQVGMLPPKLAQMIVNLAVGQLPEDKLASICDIPAGDTIPRPKLDKTILDPFCGTGVTLQEALLMGYGVIGYDIDPRMTEYSRVNLEWLIKNYNLDSKLYDLKTADATKARWEDFDFAASEAFLGRPLSSLPDQNTLDKIMSDCSVIITKFLQNLAPQTKPQFRMCLAIPAWKTKDGFKRLSTLDKLPQLGYNRVKFVHATNSDLIYHRPDQIVARELVVLERI